MLWKARENGTERSGAGRSGAGRLRTVWQDKGGRGGAMSATKKDGG